MRSLQARLSMLALGCIAAVALPFFVLSYAKVVEEVDELSDARLAQNARTIEALSARTGFDAEVAGQRVEIESWHPVRDQPVDDANAAAVEGHPYETEIGFQFWNSAAALRLTTRDLGDLAYAAAAPGFADIRIGGERWRIFTLDTPDHGRVRAAERTDSRREIAHDLLLQNAAPLLLGLPLLAVLAGWAVRRGLRPIATVAARLEARAPGALGAVDMHDAPREIEPLLGALNGLLRRLRAVLDQERGFTANAAHELRTPLAGALVHLANAQAAAGENERVAAIADARGGLERMARIVNQMLDLARWDGSASERAVGRADLARCIDEELAEFGAAAVGKDVEIVRSIDPTAQFIEGWEPGLRALVRNLLDNALRYGFEHGRIEIETLRRGDRIVLAISDSGPGIVPSRRAHMLERFQRGGDVRCEGSGLGLSIVARIAEVHRARLDLLDAHGRRGLRVEVAFPAPDAPRVAPQRS